MTEFYGVMFELRGINSVIGSAQGIQGWLHGRVHYIGARADGFLSRAVHVSSKSGLTVSFQAGLNSIKEGVVSHSVQGCDRMVHALLHFGADAMPLDMCQCSELFA